MIDHNHPAVEAADAAVREKDGLDASYLVNIPHALTAALPRLTADDLRNTPAGRALMAEGWTVGAEYAGWGTVDDYDNPYRETKGETDD